MSKTKKYMTVVELYEKGIIGFLLRKGFVSPSSSNYIEYFIKFDSYRKQGYTYRKSVSLLSQEYRVSCTTIKKAIRIVNNSIDKPATHVNETSASKLVA